MQEEESEEEDIEEVAEVFQVGFALGGSMVSNGAWVCSGICI